MIDSGAVNRRPNDKVLVEEYTAERVKVRVASEAEGYLVLADSYYPGWRAWVDGEPATIERAFVALRAVAVPAGEHVVEFAFEPESWRIGAVVSLGAWLALAGAVLVRRFRQWPGGWT